MTGFSRIELRTSDVAAAREFYGNVLGDDDLDVVELPADSAARGARPHWLGQLAVDDVERVAARFVELGATRLGPTRLLAEGHQLAILRDPGGAVVGLTNGSDHRVRGDVVWYLLNSAALERSMASYCALFGWQMTERLELGGHGTLHNFAWTAKGPSVGSMVDITARPGVHPHWLFHFRVARLEPAVAHVRAAGGVVLGPFILPMGDRVAVCDDPQGAAFAMRESASDGDELR